jgi:hypothetical protein
MLEGLEVAMLQMLPTLERLEVIVVFFFSHLFSNLFCHFLQNCQRLVTSKVNIIHKN